MTDPRYTLLFVDDEADVVELLGQLFARRYDVLTASSGQEALEILRTRPVDLLITDQKMPEMTGLELVQRARSEGIGVTSILLTGYTDPADLIAAINSGGIYRYLTKPWEVSDLMLAVQQALETTQLKRDKERLTRQLERRLDALGVLYEVSRTASPGGSGYDDLVDRVLSAVDRVLPYDCGGALVVPSTPGKATLRLRCRTPVSEAGLLAVKDAILSSHQEQTGDDLQTVPLSLHVKGSVSAATDAASTFQSALHVPLTARGRQLGTLSLFARAPGVWSREDGALLDTLANQTTGAVLALQASETAARQRIERMVGSMPEGVVLIDEGELLEVVNPVARSLLRFGDAPSEWTTRALVERLGFHPIELVHRRQGGGRAKAHVETLRLGERDVLATVTPVDDEHGALRSVCLTLRDITEQRRLEERKDEFVSMVSHELRTPLTSISGALDLVLAGLTGEVNEKQARYLTMAKESSEQLNAIVDDLLDLSKFDRGRLPMEFQVTWLDDVVNRNLERFAAALQERQISVTTSLPEGPLRVIADPERLGQVLGNLLTNAVKFTPVGGEVRVSVSSTPQAPGFATLSIWNSGEAIDEGDLERIFERFEQARTPANRTVRGTGLGLSICRTIVEAHGGSIWAEHVEEGARFVVVLPAEPAEVIKGTELDPQRARDEAVQASPASVVVVEADAETAWILKALLRSRGHEVHLAPDADEGLQLARRHRPALIILDVRLPDVDGLALAEIFQRDPDTRHASLLVISARDERIRARRAGVEAYLGKPLQPDAFLATVDGLLRHDGAPRQGRVLVVEDDPAIQVVCEEVLGNLGFEVQLAPTLAAGRQAIRDHRPDVLLLDVALPDGDGHALLESLQAEAPTGRPISTIFISARGDTASKVRGLRLGADDYLAKPFDALELGARVEAVLRRREMGLAESPTTQLPGVGAIERAVERHTASGTPFAYCAVEILHFGAYDAAYGFAKADAVLRQTGDSLREIFDHEARDGDFLGHVSGASFAFIASLQSVDIIARRALETFDRVIPLYYDREDREGIPTIGGREPTPIMTLSVAAVVTTGASHVELCRAARQLAQRLPTEQGSMYRRQDGLGSPVRADASGA